MQVELLIKLVGIQDEDQTEEDDIVARKHPKQLWGGPGKPVPSHGW